jgi:hypothetical protein
MQLLCFGKRVGQIPAFPEKIGKLGRFFIRLSDVTVLNEP